jgi:hypothetical protein
MLRFHLVGEWTAGEVQITWTGSSRIIVPEVEALIDRDWAEAMARPGVHLFDGPMCRLESWATVGATLQLALSHTSYKPFFGTNLSNPGLADRHGRNILANPVGVSPALVSNDGFLLLGRRNGSVAYYPHRLHPFAGALEPREDLDIFEDVGRELSEELSFAPTDIADIRCTGIVEDLALRQPELIFLVRSTRTRVQIESQVDGREHRGSWAIPADRGSLEAALDDRDAFTPVAVAALLLWGRLEFGEDWFDAHRDPV